MCMKRLLVLLVLCPILFSCNDKEIKKLQEENSRLQQEANYKDSTINGLVQSFNDIEDNLSQITQKESSIRMTAKGNVEFKEDAKARINEEIQAINGLMEKNKHMIDSLTRRLKKSNIRISEFKKMVARLNAQIAQKDSTINSLKEQLVALNFKIESLNMRVDTLSRMNDERGNRITQQIDALNTAYYVIGTFKELKQKGILSKEGGIIGIGGAAKLKDFSNESFTRIDITKTSSFTLPGKKAKLVTTHAPGSFNWEGAEKKRTGLTITDAAGFWKASKYLVIVID
jgi:septal ring factor EnvC (AmiA/AmiB activator)